jgi:uncharacterized oligopeptide transporter (OPT) family protein
MSQPEFKPYVSVDSKMAELTFKAMLVGVSMAILLGAANAYLGMKAGLTVAATFPAAVMAMAILKPLRGTILEENIARTTASVGEAMIAGAIFTIPAFVISGVWESLKPLESTAIMMIGGVLGFFLLSFYGVHWLSRQICLFRKVWQHRKLSSPGKDTVPAPGWFCQYGAGRGLGISQK